MEKSRKSYRHELAVKRELTIWSSHTDWSHSNENAPKAHVPSTKKWTRRVFLVPIAVLGMLGFAVNYCNVSFQQTPNCPCQPKFNIVFLKTHKCAGSSIQNIFMRYGDVHNLTFAVPPRGNYIGHPRPFDRRFLLDPQREDYHILTHHARFNYENMRQLMGSKALFITILRDPVKVFESLFHYYNFALLHDMTISQYVRYYADAPSKHLLKRYLNGRMGLNQMMFDLGADPLGDDAAVYDYVKNIESWFDLVLIADRMDESLILMKELLCWKTEDVVTFKLNSLIPGKKTNLSEEDIGYIKVLNFADQILYDHFYAEFDRKVSVFGAERMKKETAKLRSMIRTWYDFCIQKLYTIENELGKRGYKNNKILYYEARSDGNVSNTCKSLIRQELKYTEYIRQRQNVSV